MENEQIVYVLYRIEDHRDREVYFLGVFSSKGKAEKARNDDREASKSVYYPDGWPLWTYTIRDEIVL